MSTSMHTPSSSAQQPPHGPTAGTVTAKPAWYRRTWVPVTAAAVIGVMLGAAASESDPTATDAYKAVVAERDTSRQDLQAAQESLAAAEDDLSAAQAKSESIAGDLPARESALADAKAVLDKAQSRLDARSRELKAAERDVAARERKVGIVETTIANNTIAGDGMYEAGKDIKAGTYKTAGGSDCYYAVLNSTDTFDIANNNNVSGPAIVTVQPGQLLELSGCNDFVWQG